MRAWIMAWCLLAACSSCASVEAPAQPAPIEPAPEPAPEPQEPAGSPKVSISSFTSYGNCMPRMIGPNDGPSNPHITAWDLDVENAKSVVFESAVLTVGDGDKAMRFDLELEEPAIALQNGAFHAQQRVKSYRNGPSFGACGEMCSSKAPTKLALTLRVDGAAQQLTAQDVYSCAH